MINMIFRINTELKRCISIVTAIILFVLLLGCESRNAVIENQSTFDTVSDSEIYREESPDSVQSITSVTEESNSEQILKIEVNGNILYADFEDNSSAKELKEKLSSGSITIDMHDYGSFEKVGDLPFTLITNDEQITTEAGDIILYQGDKLTIYYDENTWSFTKVAKIRNADSSLKNILGDGDVTVILSLE